MQSVELSSGAASDALALLHAGIDAVQAVGLLGLDAEELSDFAVGLLSEGERLAASTAEVVGECECAKVAPRVGSIASLTAHLASFTRGPTAAIAPSRTLGLWLLDFPDFADAWRQGTLTEAHVRELKGIDNPRSHMCLIRDQQIHIDNSQILDFSDWLNSLGYWLLGADPDGSLPKEPTRAYGLRFRTDRKGDVEISGRLDPLSGEALRTMVDHEASAIRRRQLEDDVEPIHQSTMRERNLMGLLRLCKRGFQRPDGGWPAPLVNIVMSEQVAEDLISRMLDGETHDPFEQPLDYFDVDKRCETIRGTPLDPRRAWPALLVGRLRRQVMKAKSRKMEVGYDVRLFNPAQKQALLVAARGQCATRGCDSPFSWLEADHHHPASRGGRTDIDEGQIRCKPDNLRKKDHIVDENDRVIDRGPYPRRS